MKEIIISEIDRVFKCDLLAISRKQNNVNGRIAVSNYLRAHEKMTLVSIGNCLNKDHASIIHYLKQHADLYKYDRNYKYLYDKIVMPEKPKKWLCNECIYPLNTNHESQTKIN